MAADDFDRAKALFKWNESTFSFMGVWPLQKSFIIFFLWMIYLLFHMSMEFWDLYNVFGIMDLTVINLAESALEIMVLVKMIALRFSSKIRNLMTRIIDDIQFKNYSNPEEKQIYLYYNEIAKKFFKIWFMMGSSATAVYHFKPIEYRIRSAIGNETLPYYLPYRTRTYFEINNSVTFWLVWTFQIPMICIHMFHSLSIGYLFTLVLHVCGKLAILVFRIRNLDVTFHNKANDESSKHFFCDVLTRHRDIIQISREIESFFQVLLLEELIFSSMIIALTSYSVLQNLHSEDKGVLLSSLLYDSAVILLLYGYCAAGEYLVTESENLLDAYYHCDWYNMSDSFKKQMIICMIAAKRPIQLTGGGFYVFSLVNYTGILKTTGGYVSVLRSIT